MFFWAAGKHPEPLIEPAEQDAGRNKKSYRADFSKIDFFHFLDPFGARRSCRERRLLRFPYGERVKKGDEEPKGAETEFSGRRESTKNP